MSREKERWRARVQDTVHGSSYFSEYAILSRLEREPDRVVRVIITDPEVARNIAHALLDWAEEYEKYVAEFGPF